MKYKIKFEIDYSKMNKQEMRDSKIEEVLSGEKEMLEMEVDPLIKLPLPEKGNIIDIDGVDYQIMDSKFKMESNCYTIVHLVESVEVIRRRKEEADKDMYNKMAQLSGAMSSSSTKKKLYKGIKSLK